MKLGECALCSKQIGRRTANGVFRYDREAWQQVIATLQYPDLSLQYVHFVICTACAADLAAAKVSAETFLHADKTAKRQLRDDTFTVISVVPEEVPHG